MQAPQTWYCATSLEKAWLPGAQPWKGVEGMEPLMSWSRDLASKPAWPHFNPLLVPQDSQLLSVLMGSASMRNRLLGEGLLAQNRPLQIGLGAVAGQPGLGHSGIDAFWAM